MEAAGAAVGITSLGIQVCQGLLAYYDDWKGYKQEITSTYESIDDLRGCLAQLLPFLQGTQLEEEKREKVKKSVRSCEDALDKLSKKLQKLQKHGKPEGLRQKAWAEVQRACYPFKASTLAKLRELVDDARNRLHLGLSALQLDVDVKSLTILSQVAADTKDITASVAQVSAQNQQILDLHQAGNFRKIVDWLAPPNPWTNHETARRHHQAQTGTWLLGSNGYKRWKNGATRHLWLSGKAGCGKTILCSTVVDDVRSHCENASNAIRAVFYFTFTDNRKQSARDALLSLVAQLCWREPGLSALRHAHEKTDRSVPGNDELEKIVISSICSFDDVFVILDALDESPEADDVQRDVLELLNRLAQSAPRLKMFATSREVRSIARTMELLGADAIAPETRAVNTDIQWYVTKELSEDGRLSKWDPAVRDEVVEKLTSKADGMFRWAYCQLQELKKLKMTKPSHIRQALEKLPRTLDETYERMLSAIDVDFRKDAMRLLRWIAYAQSPPTLAELVQVAIVDPGAEILVQLDDQGGVEDTLDILAGLVTIAGRDHRVRSNNDKSDSYSGEEHVNEEVSKLWHNVNGDTKVRLAHFSVKEYLESERIVSSGAAYFALEPSREHGVLTQSCLAYLLHYSRSADKTLTEKDFLTLPLLQYAARSWYYHCSLQRHEDVDLEVRLLSDWGAKNDWLHVHRPDQSWLPAFDVKRLLLGSGLYYASYVGLSMLVDSLLRAGLDVNVQGGYYGNALQAASYGGHETVVQKLLDAGADVHAQGGVYSNALQAASYGGHETVVQKLLDAGADVHAQGGGLGNALQAASYGGHETVVQKLLDAGADVHAQGGVYSNALQAASYRGHETVVQKLLDAGADVHAQGGVYGNALQTASSTGHETVVQKLLDAGADVHTQGGHFGNALQAASSIGHETVVQKLLDAGADVHAQGGHFGNALQAASSMGHETVVQKLLDAGARSADVGAA